MSDSAFFSALHDLWDVEEIAEAAELRATEDLFNADGSYAWDAMFCSVDTLLCCAIVELDETIYCMGFSDHPARDTLELSEAEILELMKTDADLREAIEMAADVLINERINAEVARALRY